MRRRGVSAPPANARGAVLVVVLMLMVAALVLSSAVAATAVLEYAMADRSTGRLRAFEAAEAGLAEALRARGWSASEPWTAEGEIAAGGRWRAEARLAAAKIDAFGGPVRWRFDIESAGEHGAARVTLLQAIEVHGALPGEPRRAGWRRLEPVP